jgi:GTPase SAR1 family protein
MTTATQQSPGTPSLDGFDNFLKSTEFQAIAGRTGVGKSSTVNSLLGREVAPVGDYEPTTFQVQQYPVELEGVPFNVVDTPGLCDDLEERDKDSVYLGKMQSAIKEFHSLWFVTELDATRVSSDEKRAIKLLSQAFQDKGRVWQSAIIVFTFAGRVPVGDFTAVLAKRTELIRREIALHAGPELAAKVPSVAVENKADTTPDGRPWRGELYVKVLTSMNREGIITFFLGTSHLLPKPPRRPEPENDRDRSDPTIPRTRRRDRDEDNDEEPQRPSRSESTKASDFTQEQKTIIHETVRNETVRRWEERGRSIGASVGSFFSGSSGASTGGSIGASVGRAIGRLASWLFG